jgi:hypothetical protein
MRLLRSTVCCSPVRSCSRSVHRSSKPRGWYRLSVSVVQKPRGMPRGFFVKRYLAANYLRENRAIATIHLGNLRTRDAIGAESSLFHLGQQASAGDISFWFAATNPICLVYPHNLPRRIARNVQGSKCEGIAGHLRLLWGDQVRAKQQ